MTTTTRRSIALLTSVLLVVGAIIARQEVRAEAQGEKPAYVFVAVRAAELHRWQPGPCHQLAGDADHNLAQWEAYYDDGRTELDYVGKTATGRGAGQWVLIHRDGRRVIIGWAYNEDSSVWTTASCAKAAR